MTQAQRILQALDNHHRPGRTCGARIRDALEHIRTSKEKPAHLVGTRGSVTTPNNLHHHYDCESP